MPENYFKIGPCAIVFNGQFIGAAANAELTINSELEDIGADARYKDFVVRTIAGLTLFVDAEVRGIDPAMALLLDANGQLTSRLIASPLNSLARELLLIPCNAEDATGYRFPNAAAHKKTRYAFRDTAEHSLQLSFEAFPDSTGLIMEKIAVSDAQRQTLPQLPEIDPAQVERALTQLLAEKLHLTVDKDIFRGGLPLGVDGVGVELTEEKLSNTAGLRTIRAIVCCRNTSRDAVFAILHSLSGLFPVYGKIVSVNGEDITFNAIMKEHVGLSAITDSGRIKHFGGLSLLLKL